MTSTLHPAKVLLLAVHFAQHADIDSLSLLTNTYTSVLHDELLLRILLTHLPETVRPDTYIGFLHNLAGRSFEPCQLTELDTSPVNSINDHEAAKRAAKLHLLSLTCRKQPEITSGDALSRFLVLRIYQMNEETGMLAQLLDLLLPFLHHDPGIHKWAASTIIPYVRKGLQYPPGISPPYSLLEFEKLPDQQAVDFLLCSADSRTQPRKNVDHDLRDIIGPWLYDNDRWDNSSESNESSSVYCPGWHQVCDWLLSQATLSWPTAIQAIEDWGGPEDVRFGHGIVVDLPASYKHYFQQTYATTILAYATKLLLALTQSAYILTLLGSPSSPRRVGDLTFRRDERDQKSETLKLLRNIAAQASKENDDFLLRARAFLLWLQDWGHEAADKSTAGAATAGTLGMVSMEYVEAEFLKLLLSRERYNLARNLYDNEGPARLPAEVIRDSVYDAALGAFDNATNPNRSRGGLKRCDEILHALPKTVSQSLPGTRRILALLKATHALSDYRLVLKQGEPFSPVVLRVHSDPISIIEKVLEQNTRAYTRLQEFLEMGMDMVRAGLPSLGKLDFSTMSTTDAELNCIVDIAERRITAMCIEAALKEDDFETAYSYVASRLNAQSSEDHYTSPRPVVDDWSWKAALQAGQYVRTERSQQPTHLGTASGNLEIRHLEQRIECLATALRVAPTSQLQEILKSFRRCEEQLDSAIKEEAANESAWGAESGVDNVPGAFDHIDAEQQYPVRNLSAGAAAQQAEEAPMSLFDLSRATARAAQRNFAAIPSLQSITRGINTDSNELEEGWPPARIRKRDQLREAATGTLVSGVGWLIGANVGQNKEESI
ncbi:protein transport protein Sec39 [Metarhizium album ARSEF 1941]|uniref:Protein transport protein Sec39 n=1 Tax=Metarhizium album (strain ARSEF 1941) TaxID=1081103 RepID=A0A0B2X6I5_METAS|nr:protein transport protein Sec39 [Metarhizium album ARSEF 1941]KHO00901.1 protein transport protein Sec39 [Metarhizium album ARSEF 1941]